MMRTLERLPAAVPSRMSPSSPVWNFTRHFLEMCGAMCIGWMVLTFPYVALTSIVGTSDPVRQLPELTVVIAAISMSAAMAVYMRWRGHDWRCIAEMSAAMFVEALVLIVVAAAGAIARPDLFVWFHGLMVPTMIAVMLYRRGIYTAPVRHPATSPAHPHG